MAVPEFVLGADKVRAVVTTKWGKKGYTALPIRTVESYYVDTSLDNDADPWQIEIGDPEADYMEMMHRDSEVRVQLYGVGRGLNPIVTGIADEVMYSSEGIITLAGRDYSALAIDSVAPPQQYRLVRAHDIVGKQAISIGFKNTNLKKQNVIKKVQYTDGSESYWEFWYRLYRKEKMWLWTEPNGMLIANELNYTGSPAYFLGSPRKNDPKSVYAQYIPIENMEITKSTQNRVGEIWVFGQKGDNGFLVTERDPTTSGWTKLSRLHGRKFLRARSAQSK
jgi:prophage tail gpP-like protein